MAKLKLGVGADAANIKATEGFKNYTGPTPPPGLYPATVKSLKLGESKTSKKPMFTAVIEIDAPKGHAAEKYNGYPVFHRLVIPDDKAYQYYELQVGQINRLVDAMAGDANKVARRALWGDQAVIDEKGTVTKIGPINLKVKGGVPVNIDTKGRSYQRAVMEKGKPKKDDKGKVITETMFTLEINDLFPSKTREPDAEPEIEEVDDEVGEDEVYEPEGVVVEADEDEDEDTAEDEVEDEEPEEDEDDEPEAAEADEEPEDDDVDFQEVAEEPEPEPEPAPKRRTRRKAF